MDPAVMAALVGIPATVLTAAVSAAAAYTGARAQARGAHRGPVDAVRRQHQRDAYAAFLQAAETYAHETQRNQAVHRASEEIPDIDPERIGQRARELRAEATEEMGGMRRTLPVVQLEGPDHVAELAEGVFSAAMTVRFEARTERRLAAWLQHRASTSSAGPPRDDPSHELTLAIVAYVTAARAYLNGGMRDRE